jgi:hypothetical protein
LFDSSIRIVGMAVFKENHFDVAQESVGLGCFGEKFTRSNKISLSCEDNGCSI